MGGRKAYPLAVHALHGHPGHLHPKNPEPVDGVGDIGLPPEWFDKTQREQWASVIERAPRGVLSETDRENVISFVVSFCEFKKAAIDARENGQVFLSAKTGFAYANPALGIMERNQKLMLAAASMIGFTPSSRTTLSRVGVGTGNAKNMPGQIAGKLARYLEMKPDKLS